MRIPVDELEKETLYAIAESFVLREGTDYGEVEASLKDKTLQVIQQLKSGEAVLIFSELHETVDVISKQAFQQQQRED
ncbi:YheU family protein [Alteromonas sp. a30]|uniref:YheU family protein n=1 Tax=Alteromonas sp. a30 TaxID=2730917 RepID=UPI0022803FBA|nr:YheU family protein [Alteromonas sp. a30]MCY7295653.1 YheU family protein [Alteromonas sp. a30]